MDWPTASVVLGILGSVTVAILKLVPQRTVVENTHGEPCASRQDVNDFRQSFNEHHKYMETRNHDVINAITGTGASLETSLREISHDLVTLLERTRRSRGNQEDG
jgi:hypothetical protein